MALLDTLILLFKLCCAKTVFQNTISVKTVWIKIRSSDKHVHSMEWSLGVEFWSGVLEWSGVKKFWSGKSGKECNQSVSSKSLFCLYLCVCVCVTDPSLLQDYLASHTHTSQLHPFPILPHQMLTPLKNSAQKLCSKTPLHRMQGAGLI